MALGLRLKTTMASVLLFSALVAEDDGARRAQHAADPKADEDLGPRNLGRRDAAHLPHALLQGVHAVHARVHVREAAAVGVERQFPAGRGVALPHEIRRLALAAE